MHIPDGYLGPPTYGSLWLAMIGIWSYAARKVQRELKTSQVPFLAMASAFSFVAMIFAVPLPGGTTAHVTGATLVAVILGPWAAVIAVSTALIIQAMLFGDGGVTAIAANCFNIAFAGPVTGYALYRFIMGVAGHITEGTAASSGHRNKTIMALQVPATAVASYVGINVAALLTAVELGIQPLIYGTGQGSTGYFPYNLGVSIPAIVIPHLTLVGALEAIVAGLVIGFIRKGNVTMGNLAKSSALVIAAMLLMQVSVAQAHDYWIENKGEGLTLVFGHGSQRLDFEAEKATSLKALDAQGKELVIQKEKKGKGLLLKISGQPASVTAVVDNGYWSKTIYGWKEAPKRKASRVVEAIRQLFYTRDIISWTDEVQRPVAGHNMVILPMQNPFTVKAGDSFSVKVLYSGNPLLNAEVNGGEHNALGKTDGEGILSVPVVNGVNLLSIEHREKINNDPDADMLDETATLTFEVKK